LKTRLLFKNNYGLPKEQDLSFKPTSRVEARNHISRDYRRDERTELEDKQILDKIMEEHKQNLTPKISELKIKSPAKS